MHTRAPHIRTHTHTRAPTHMHVHVHTCTRARCVQELVIRHLLLFFATSVTLVGSIVAVRCEMWEQELAVHRPPPSPIPKPPPSPSPSLSPLLSLSHT